MTGPDTETTSERGSVKTPGHLREGVRSGIVGAIERDVERRGGRTAHRLVAAGALGILGAIGMVEMLSAHPYGHHPSSHAVVFSAIWSGILVVGLALVFLDVRTPTLPLARAARIGILGLGLAGVCSAFCPDPHFLGWWVTTPAGSRVRDLCGLPSSALCFGTVTTLAIAALATAVALGTGPRERLHPAWPAGMLLLVLAPGLALQSVDTAPTVYRAWWLGTAVGAYAGAAIGIAARQRLHDVFPSG